VKTLVDTSAAVEACIGTSHHFGCTIAAIIERPVIAGREAA